MIIAIVGATGTGKSALSLGLAKVLKAEIINADAFQVYQGMDIGTAKLSQEERLNIPHHMLDMISADQTFDVAQYQKKARELLDAHPQKDFIFVGGSGFYLKSVLHDFNFPEKRPSSIGESLSNEDLFKALETLDPESLLKIHRHNRKRLLNAYQRASSGTPMSAEVNQSQAIYDYQIFGLELPRKDLYQAIDQRVDTMILKGLKNEVQGLFEKGMSETSQAAIGYKEWTPYFQNQRSEREVIDTIKQNTRRYAKRQISYFKNQFDVTWLDKNEGVERLVNHVLSHLKK